jgi:hypothetical protein
MTRQLVLHGLHEQRPEQLVALLADTECRVTLARMALFGDQAKVSSDVPALGELRRVIEGVPSSYFD